MYKLIQAGPRSLYINCPAKIGVSRINDTQVRLIDSGDGEDTGRKVRQILEREGRQFHAAINTHSSADHIGGNRYLQQQTGCEVYTKGVEAASTAYPELEPVFFYGGYPFTDLRRGFLMASSNQVGDMDSLYEGEALRGLEIIPLPGHFFQMVGVCILGGIPFLVDCLSSCITLDKYKISSIYNVASYLEILGKVMIVEVALFIPVHVEAADSIHSLAGYNKQCAHEITAKLLELCAALQTFESVLKAVFNHYGLTMSFQQHVLIGSTIRFYLAWPKDTGLLQAYVQDNRII